MNTVSSPEAISPSHASHEHAVSRLYEIVTALSLTVGRRGVARAVADLAQLSPTDRVLDVGCGPGTAVRVAARRGATAAGIDPSPTMLALGRGISALRHTGASAGSRRRQNRCRYRTRPRAWSGRSARCTTGRQGQRPRGGVRRVLAPDGRVLLAERLVLPRFARPCASWLDVLADRGAHTADVQLRLRRRTGSDEAGGSEDPRDYGGFCPHGMTYTVTGRSGLAGLRAVGTLVPVLYLDDVPLGIASVGDLDFAETGDSGAHRPAEGLAALVDHVRQDGGDVTYLEGDVTVTKAVGQCGQRLHGDVVAEDLEGGPGTAVPREPQVHA